MGEAASADKVQPPYSSAPVTLTKPEPDYYDQFVPADGRTTYDAIRESIQSGKSKVTDAVLFCGRFDRDGRMVRECAKGAKPYKLLRCKSDAEFREAVAQERRVREFFTSSSDAGSTFQPDPNQYTEFTPYFSGPFNKQQYYDYFIAHARAFEQSTHGIGKRIVDILRQYAIGRGVSVKCQDDKKDQAWGEYAETCDLMHKLRAYWTREYLVYGENFIDLKRMVSVDPSTILDIVCDGDGEYIDDVLYYQQMFQTATQMWSGINVPGVAGSADTTVGRYIIRQIPYDQIIHVKANVVSVEKRGRSFLFPVLGWIKRLTDTLNAKVLSEQLKNSLVYDDTVDGSPAQVDAHAARFNYIPVAPTLFAHNKTVTRQLLAPREGASASSDIVQELLSFLAAIVGLPRDHLNAIVSGAGSRATAIVASEPFSKVIEDLQEDIDYLLRRIILEFCKDKGFNYDSDEWSVIFPSVTKDSTKDTLGNIALAEAQGWFSKSRAGTMAAAELDQDDYDFDDEQDDIKQEKAEGLAEPVAPPPPAGRFGSDGGSPADDKQDIIDQHSTL